MSGRIARFGEGFAPAVRVRHVPGLARRLLSVWEASSASGSPHTLRARRGDLHALGRFLGLAGEGEALRVATVERLIFGTQADAFEAITKWRSSLLSQNYAAATVARRIASIRSLVRTAQDVGLPWRLSVKGPRVRRRGRLKAPTHAAAWRVLARLDGQDGAHAKRDRAILAVLVFGMLRRSEVAALDLADFDGGVEPALTVRGKGGDVEEIGIAAIVRDAIAAWVRLRGRSPGPLFRSLGRRRADGRLTPETIAAICKRRGLGSPHAWRHAGVTALLRAGHVLPAQRLARHANLSTTDGYAGRVDDLTGWASRFLAGEEP